MDITSLSLWRLRGVLIITYRLLHSLFGCDLSHLFVLNSNNLRGNMFKLTCERFFTTTRQYFVLHFQQSIWGLEEIADRASVNSFKKQMNKLDLWASQNAVWLWKWISFFVFSFLLIISIVIIFFLWLHFLFKHIFDFIGKASISCYNNNNNFAYKWVHFSECWAIYCK